MTSFPFRCLRLGAWGLFCMAAMTLSVAAEQPPGSAAAGLKDLDGHFPMQVPKTLDQWNARAEPLRLQLRVALGIDPMPAISTAAPTLHGRMEMDGYSIEKVYFESLPGLYVTGSLYRPLGIAAPDGGFPAVLYAHGHWADGRFFEASPGEVRRLLATGAERFENAAINHMQAACVQLARMGCVVLQYDMIGYADSQQISFDRAHRYGTNFTNPAEEAERWLLYSPRAEGYNQSVMSLQTINSIRAIEALRSLPDIDEHRIAITGASGGGTQSFITAAVDPRLAGAFPAVMVSTGMQGGCTCENACGLRVGTGNVEIASLIAPRPLAMTTAKDWTLTMPEDGFPQLQELYGLFGKKSSVELFPGPQFPHNYNHVSRVALYGWVNRLFSLGLAEPVLERDFDLAGAAQLTVWDAEHAKPESGEAFEKQLTAQWAKLIEESLHILPGDDAATKASKIQRLRSGWDAITAPAAKMAQAFPTVTTVDGISLVSHLDSSPAASSVKKHSAGSPKAGGWVNVVVGGALPTFLDRRADSEGNPTYICEIVDPLGGDERRQPLVANPRPAAAYTYGYNAPRAVRKLAVLLRLVQETSRQQKRPIRLIVSPADTFLAAAATLHQPAGTIEKVVVLGKGDQTTDPFAQVDSITHNDFLPGSLRYQGLTGLLSVLPPGLVDFSRPVDSE